MLLQLLFHWIKIHFLLTIAVLIIPPITVIVHQNMDAGQQGLAGRLEIAGEIR